ncbi:Conidial yellow pigment biosynthesis polyketide synthase [Tolypocladium ophioglossoides CBS 100239]|uniref:Conidial yellow pigment biosynthesis polyketide synthase n=1 Tax=Tolypocladium ophioglossoides (strain CBS 100239) TaxID=1163406 RepID=A0A0L0MZY9_TOLOC|nr:Conidial yellow pigment biosynthesis polyketide synthase [Tolypocladium ophioglossoides CBS 100239]
MTGISELDNGSCESTIFLFGPHVGTFTKQSVEKLVRPFSHSVHRTWILDTIAGLPKYWDALIDKIPNMAGTIPSHRQLADLERWLRHGAVDMGMTQDDDANLPSIVVGPLVVFIQLTQYWRYLELTRTNNLGETADLQADLVLRQKQQGAPKVESLGFCAGLLAAVAVASASNRQEFYKYGAVAVRLAMLIGALIDVQEAWDKGHEKGGSVSYAIAWRGQKQADEVTRIVESLSPNAYVAVLYDEARATVVTSQRTAPLLLNRLQAAGVTAAEIGIKGHIHSPDPDRKHNADLLVDMCRTFVDLQYVDAASLALPTYINQAEGKPLSRDGSNLTEMVLHAILVEQCNWHGTFLAVTQGKKPFIVTFGLERCVPPTLMRSFGTGQVHFEDLADKSMIPVAPPRAVLDIQPQPQPQHVDAKQTSDLDIYDNTIAVIGMSVKTAGADDLAEFADMLKTGQSQHELITRERLMHDMLFREAPDSDPTRKFYGCFFRDADAFDHKFFKRSPRESAAMDPQSRLVLQAAYQAVEQSGYFTETTNPESDGRDKMHVGVYLGSCGVDYEHNITCHEPNAFTATGALKSFITGRVSHYFGWTGPSMTFDTACSSSAVAIHTACRNLLSGECTAALAGGSNTVTNMLWFQNLSAGSFVSPTGQCKPFDDGADGYCRAEGLAFVFLKKLSHAVRDGNPVLATIPSTAVYQNQNCTPLFVPNAPSLSLLFGDVMRKAKVAARDVSLVEAHGTGTPVGDPAEYESIRFALGGPGAGRDKTLPIGSVKGHIGHTEGASGVIALVKIITMMRGAFIPPQASFTKMNRNINVRPDDMMEVGTKLRPWVEEHKIALLNNYGACGSNASLIVTQPPKYLSVPMRGRNPEEKRYPFWIAGLDARSIAAYSPKLGPYLRSCPKDTTLADISFHMNRQSNRGLAQGFVFACRSAAELHEKLEQVAGISGKEDATKIGIVPARAERPVILCLGGQVSRFVGLDRKLFDSAAVLRRHLDDCDAVVTSLGLNSIYASPDIFSREPVRDAVKLQTMLFAMQYACAKSWMDCALGTKVAAVVGHSFGEITALCVAGVLSLEHTVKLVASRAKLVRDAWGVDQGAMMALEADEALVHELLREANRGSDGSATIACYNGPRSFTIAGSTSAVDAVQATMTSDTPKFGAIKSKRLEVTNAFHSALVDKLVDGLGQVGKELTFHKPVIPVERATETPVDGNEMDWTFVPRHMREPVFFNHAVQRLAKHHPQAIFLESGSNSTITIMAARALAQSQISSPDAHHFQAVSIATETGFDGLTDATVALWKQGLRVSFWAHHALQTREYAQFLLPPYQFDKSSRHWLPMKSARDVVNQAAKALVAGTQQQSQREDVPTDAKMLGLWHFVDYQDRNDRKPRFRINTASEKYNSFVLGHLIAQTAPICPGTLECDIVIEALFSLHPGWKEEGVQPEVRDMVNHTPICIDPTRVVYMDMSALDKKHAQWSVHIFSVSAAGEVQTHAEARVYMRQPTDASSLQQFAHFERLVSHARCQELLGLPLDAEGVDVLQGRNVYRAFNPIVEYGEMYRGVRYLVGRGHECAGHVQLPRRHRGDTWLDVPLSDSFSQVGGLWVNLMTDLPPGDMYIATGCEVSMRSARAPPRAETDVWHVYARHSRQGDKAYMTDLFVFDAAIGLLVEVMLGVQYGRVAKTSMSRILARMTTDESVLRNKLSATTIPVVVPAATSALAEASSVAKRLSKKTAEKKDKPKKEKAPPGRRDITDEVRNLVASVSGIEASEMELDSELADFGIDSLMGMELAREVELAFKCKLDQAEQMEATNLRNFVACVSNALFGADHAASVVDGEVSDDEEDEDDSSSNSEGGETWSQPSQDRGKQFSSSETLDSDIFTPPLEKAEPKPPLTTPPVPPVVSNLALSPSDVLESFGEVKMDTDSLMREYQIDKTEKAFLAGSNRLCAALVVEAFDELGSPLRTAAGGQLLERVPFLPQHRRLMDCVYEILEHDARLIDIDVASGQLSRTYLAAPRKTSHAILQELLAAHPQFAVPNRLAYYAGKQLAGVLSGKTDGIRVLFGSPEGRELTAAMYCEHTFNRMNYIQMRGVVEALAQRIQSGGTGDTFKVLEMGAGTGGTTLVMAPFLASLEERGIMRVEYTFTDLSPSMVANARRRLSKLYPFMRFAVHDIEKPPAEELRGQHLVLASNAIHATHNLVVSASNVRRALRPDGFLMMLEMTEVVPFIDLVFGLLEGWWLFDDGRKHAVVPAERWERELHAAGFGHVDWTDGNLPENAFQKVVMALASGTPGPRLPRPTPEPEPELTPDVVGRTAEAERLVTKYSDRWATPKLQTLSV